MRYLLPAAAACFMLLAHSCTYSPNDKGTVSTADVQLEQIPAGITADTIPTLPNNSGTDDRGTGQPAPHADWDKKIIKTGTLNIEVEDYAKYNDHIHQLVQKWEAYIAGEQQNSSGYKIENDVTIKIPVRYFDEAVQELSSGTGKLLMKQINAQDVTAEYLDTKARMEAKKRIRIRYLDMLNKARNMEEVLQVEKEINAIQEQVEAAQGRMNYLGHGAAYSTLHLTFFQVLDAGAFDEKEPSYGNRILNALSNGLKWTGELIILLTTLWPVWLAIGLIIWFVRRTTRRPVTNKAAQHNG